MTEEQFDTLMACKPLVSKLFKDISKIEIDLHFQYVYFQLSQTPEEERINKVKQLNTFISHLSNIVLSLNNIISEINIMEEFQNDRT